MRRPLALLVLGVLVVACSGQGTGGGSTVGPTESGEKAFPTSSFPSPLGSDAGPAVGEPTPQPSTARVQLVNAYVPGDEEPYAVDVYAGYTAPGNVPPLVSAPFGEASEPFDPGCWTAR